MIFYDCSTAPSPRRARIFLKEKQAEFETVEVDLRNAEQLGEAYRQINPACTVPALQVDDGVVLTENAGIAAYLEAAYPETDRGNRRFCDFPVARTETAPIARSDAIGRQRISASGPGPTPAITSVVDRWDRCQC